MEIDVEAIILAIGSGSLTTKDLEAILEAVKTELFERDAAPERDD
ncbi:MAG: hypothetical protein PHV77_07370 [Candidatus Omnitrophica bacterium]|nr:hypothetical protein [Candidatus Omnitrophota bacterium]